MRACVRVRACACVRARVYANFFMTHTTADDGHYVSFYVLLLVFFKINT